MSSKKFTRRIDQLNYTTCYRLVQKYHQWKEGAKKRLVDKKLLKLLFKRAFCLFILIFRFNKYPHKIQYRGKLKNFIKQLAGFYVFKKADIPVRLDHYPPLIFPSFHVPAVTIIIAVFNKWEFTYCCLKSILANTTGIPYKIIVVDDCSTDETAAGLKACENITVVRNEQNMGFLRSCNRAAALADTKFICFLNNDTLVVEKWLYHMIAVFDLQQDTGIVGAKLVYPDGLLQEAGGLVTASGKPANFGRDTDPSLYRYNYLRETDYCSGACIIIQRDDFAELNGFDEQYAPAYYEDTELCFAVRYKLNKKVFYQPMAEVVHFEGVSSGKRPEEGNVKSYQVVNATTFESRWAAFFNRFSDSDRFEDQVDKFSAHKKKLLFIDGTIPYYDKDSGSRRMFELIKIFLSLDVEVYFMPEADDIAAPYRAELITMGVRLIYEHPAKEKRALLNELLPGLDYAWICRPHLNEKYATLVKQFPNIYWIYDTVDLHYLRLERSLQYEPAQGIDQTTIATIKKQELDFAKNADLTIVVTPAEAGVLEKEGAGTVKVIPNIHRIMDLESAPVFEEREGLCFIGSYEHRPNVDAVLWLVREIMPLVWRQLPEIRLNLLGSNPPPEVLALSGPLVQVPGYLQDVSAYFYNSRLFVAPLRYGAGMKGKIGQAMEFGLPVITTAIGVEGMELLNGEDVLLAETRESFADAILRLYRDKGQWQQISKKSQASVRRYAPENVRELVKEIIVFK
ncbi:glycosyltransferase [Niabella beijingensis]|uniref:glycosyltransferase n=1 Tax=Niabella beijingensis TaxID=2872700 RepID=UPI001CBAA006|nr:glycosyltransferase [Niabella beijingensis]MBZ4188248.1 glycosyltransferase [Niabella beijingensis]